jgi:hypothetical protein
MTLRTTMTWLDFRRSTLERGSACLMAAVLAAGSTVAIAAHVGKADALTGPVEALKQPEQSTRKAGAGGLAGLPPFASARAFADLKHLVSFARA